MNEPRRFVSPDIVVPEPGGGIHLGVDMRKVNQAVKWIRHFIPMIDGLLQDMNESRVM